MRELPDRELTVIVYGRKMCYTWTDKWFCVGIFM